MLSRTYIYLHLAAVCTTALAAYWDRNGSIPTGVGGMVYDLGIVAVYLLPAFPLAALAIISLSDLSRQQRIRTAIIAVCATVAQFVAAIPLFQ